MKSLLGYFDRQSQFVMSGQPSLVSFVSAWLPGSDAETEKWGKYEYYAGGQEIREVTFTFARKVNFYKQFENGHLEAYP